MVTLLCIDTATDICSVALSQDEKILAFRESGDDRSHAVKLAVYIDEVLKETGLKAKELSAVAVSMGPGSYTGLRIGVSTAKGLCYGAGIPLIAVSTLQAMCYGINREYLDQNKLNDFYFCPMLDARRLEVYTALYNTRYEVVKDISAEILEEGSYNSYLEKKPVVFFGSGAGKALNLLNHANTYYSDSYKHTAKNLIVPALQKHNNLEFSDIAYFEPFYLKDFIATIPKNNILNRNS